MSVVVVGKIITALTLVKSYIIVTQGFYGLCVTLKFIFAPALFLT